MFGCLMLVVLMTENEISFIIMNFDVNEEFNLTEDVRDIEMKFFRFYSKVIKDYFDLGESFHWPTSISRAKQTVIKNDFHLFNRPEELFSLCIEDTCLALRNFYSSLVEYAEIAKYLSKKGLVTMYCVTCKSLFTAIGICSVIDEAVEQYGSSYKINTKKIQMIVTNKRENWKDLCSYIIERVNLCYKNVKIKLDFIEERSDRLSVDVFRTLKEVDMVVMSRYLSLFQYLTIRTHFLEVILNRMKDLSILFYMDENHEMYYNTLKHLMSKTDTLVEIINKETAYEPLDGFENTDYYSEFQFLRKTVFKRVLFSTCIKFCQMKDYTSVNKDIKNDVSSLSESRRRIKQKILERFKKENSFTPHLEASKVNYLRISSKSLLKASVQTTVPKTSMIKNTEKSSKINQNSNIYPLTSQITTFSQKSKMELLQSRQKTTPNCETSSENKAFEKLQDTYKYLEGRKKPNSESLKINKDVDKFVSKNPPKYHKYPGERKKPNTDTVKINKTVDNFALTNPQKKYECSRGTKKSDAGTVKSSKVPAQLTAINQENKNKQLNINKQNAGTVKSNKVPAQSVAINRGKNKKQSNITKQNAETVKSSKVVGKPAIEDLKIKNKPQGANKVNAGEVKSNKVVGMLVTMNLRSKYTYSEEETTISKKADNLEESKSTHELASMKLESKNGYKSPHLSTEESLSRYANHLSDIYYSKYFDKCKPRTPKL